MSDSRPNLSPYNYCSWNPIGRTDPTGALDDKYFDENGNYLGDDKVGNNIRFIGNSTFSLITNNGDEKTVIEEGKMLKNSSVLFSKADVSNDISMKVISYFNSTGIPLFDDIIPLTDPLLVKRMETEQCILFNNYKSEIGINLDNVKTGIWNNYFNLLSDFDHEGKHIMDFLLDPYEYRYKTSKPVREISAIEYQRLQPNYFFTDDNYKCRIEDYLKRQMFNE